MEDPNNAEEVLAEHGRRRREFVVKSARVAVTAPAISLLLSHTAGARPELWGVVVTAPAPPV